MRLVRKLAVPLGLLLASMLACNVSFAASYYVDCSQGTNGSGTMASPWNAIGSVNSHGAFSAGDSILFKRGTTCNGDLEPAGSGSSGSPITIDAYSTGARPTLNGGSTNPEVIKLSNQHDWTIQNLALVGGTTYGLNIQTVSGASLSGFTVVNVSATGVTGTSTQRLFSGGEIFISTTDPANETISNVLINGVQAGSTAISEGIFINAGQFESQTAAKGSNITVENSLVHDVAGDGIVVNDAQNVLLQGNVVYNTGQCAACTGSTPNSLWEYNNTNVEVRNNESYNANTWSNDGGGLDIDYWNANNTVEYNYSHDNAGYCVAVFGGESGATTNSIIRYNICSNNNTRSDFPGAIPGDIWIFTFDNGTIDGVQIYNNTSYWNPQLANDAELIVSATFSGSNPNFYKNNIVYSTQSELEINIDSISTSMAIDYNLYYTTSGTLFWRYNGTSYSTFASYKSASSKDAHSLNSNPNLNSPTYHSAGFPITPFTLNSGSPAIDAGTNVCSGISGCSMGTRDFFGNPIPQGAGFDIGAHEYSGSRVTAVDDSITGTGTNQFNYVGSWTHCTTSCTVATPNMYNFSNSWSNTTNDYVTIQFSGTQIAVLGLLDTHHGNGAVSIDGGTETTIDFYASSRQGAQLLWTSPFLSNGTHTLKIRVTGTKNTKSTDYYVVPDAVRITSASLYKLINLNSGQDVDIASSSTSPGALSLQWPDFNASHQLWTITPDGGGYYLTNQNSFLVLEDPSGSSSSGTQLDQQNPAGSAWQHWTPSAVTGQPYLYTFTNGSSGLRMDVSGSSTTAGASIVQATSSSSSSQQWIVVPTS